MAGAKVSTDLTRDKVAVAMHCNLRSPDVAPVVLGFNYEAHNAPAYKLNASATLAEP